MTIWCVIPVFNHAGTLADVVRRAREHLPVLVVDDGSTDWTPELQETLKSLGAHVIRHQRNEGKGAAILTALREADAAGVDYIVTLDADGQHYPEELPKFIDAIEMLQQETLLVGCREFGPDIPKSSCFGRSFANFWFRLESGAKCGDCQSGFRAYPVKATLRLECAGRRYSFEAEVLARASWGGVAIHDIPIKVHYPKDRISHFDKLKDNLRLTAIHSRLVTRRLIPWPAKWVLSTPRPKPQIIKMLRHPWQTIKELFSENATPCELAWSAVVATLLGVAPIFGFHIAAILYVTTRFKLNPPFALALQNIYAPPLSPLLCIELGYYMQHGEFLTTLSFQSSVAELHLRFLDWMLGSLILAPLFSVIVGTAVYFIARFVQRPKEADTALLSSSRGPKAGLLFFSILLKCTGIHIATACVWPISFFYALFDRTAAKRARPTLDALHPNQSAFMRFLHRWRLFTRQGQAILVLHYLSDAGHTLPVVNDIHPDAAPFLNEKGKGCVALNSHFGCWQAELFRSNEIKRPLLFLAHPDAKPQLDKFQAVRGEGIAKISTADANAGGLLEVMSHLNQGGMAGLMGDRVMDGNSIETAFSARTLKLPPAPWLLAARTHTPVIIFLTALQCHPLALVYHVAKPIWPADSEKRLKSEELAPYAKEYARVITEFSNRFPDQWFKFEE